VEKCEKQEIKRRKKWKNSKKEKRKKEIERKLCQKGSNSCKIWKK
jgi:hypothetical protein